MSKSLKTPDFIKPDGILLIVILLVLSIFAYYQAKPYHPDTCSYTILKPNGKKIVVLPQVHPIKIQGKLGSVIIEWNEEGMVRIASSSCPSQVCVHTGWIGVNNATICVPNAIVVECNGKNKSEIDGISR